MKMRQMIHLALVLVMLLVAVLWSKNIATTGYTTAHVWTGTLLQQPQGMCGKGDLYTATDLPLGQQIFICGGGHTWYQMGTLNSPILTMNKGSLGVNIAMLNLLTSQTIPTSFDPGCTLPEHIGRRWMNNTDPANIAYFVCLAQSGTVQWVNEGGTVITNSVKK